MGLYPARETERAMKVQEVILRAMSGQIKWFQAAEILGMSARSMRRWRWRLEQHGYDGLFDRRTQRPSPKRVPIEIIEHVLRLYRDEYFDFNVKHFHEKLLSEHGIELSYQLGQERSAEGRAGGQPTQARPTSQTSLAAPPIRHDAAHRRQHPPVARSGRRQPGPDHRHG